MNKRLATITTYAALPILFAGALYTGAKTVLTRNKLEIQVLPYQVSKSTQIQHQPTPQQTPTQTPALQPQSNQNQARPQENTEYQPSQELIALAKKYEGFSPVSYNCPAGYPTIGYGHLVDKDSPRSVTREGAEVILTSDLKKSEKPVRKKVEVRITSSQRDALVDFIFNLGAGRFSRSTLLKKLNKGDYQGAAEEFPKWIYAGGKPLRGLINRRAEEKAMFLRDTNSQSQDYANQLNSYLAERGSGFRVAGR